MNGTPEPLLTSEEQSDFTSVPVVSGTNGSRPKLTNTGKRVLNLANYNYTGLRIAGNNPIKVRAIETLRRYGVGSCGPPGFYGTIDVHRDPAFYKAWLPNRGINYRYPEGLAIFSLEDVLLSVENERRKCRGPLTRRFVVAEDIFTKDGATVDLPNLIELKHTCKYRLILDEGISLAQRDEPDAGLTKLYNVSATQIGVIVGLVANGPNLSGGFCAGSHIVADHQRINGTSFVFYVTVPALLVVFASKGINILRNTLSVLGRRRRTCARFEPFSIGSRPTRSPRMPPRRSSTSTCILRRCYLYPHPRLRSCRTLRPLCNSKHRRLTLRDIVDKALAEGVRIAGARRLRGQKSVEASASLSRLLSCKKGERAASVIWAAVMKVLANRK
ncbi:serine palmitoyltransferase [Lactarius deliciosus]|nr:serine palmitoyltransferase [Lactarius deliciosus]